MSHPKGGPDYHDTIRDLPAIPEEVLAIVRQRDSQYPKATSEDVRRELLRAAIGPSCITCPTCLGFGVVDEDEARQIRAVQSTMLPPPAPSGLGDELEPTVFQDEPTRPER